MHKRILGFSLVITAGWLLVEVLRRRFSSIPKRAPQLSISYTPEPLPDDVVAEEVAAELETPLGVEEVDLAELAFVASAVDSERTPNTPLGQSAQASGLAGSTQAGEVVGYCMRCRTKRTISGVHVEETRDGRHMARGTCPCCGAKIARFVKEAE